MNSALSVKQDALFSPNQYHVPDGRYDELIQPTGQPRPHWQTFITGLNSIGREALSGRWDQAQRQIRENGVTYNVYGNEAENHRAWQLDPVPLLIPHEDWAGIEQSLQQRHQLLNLIVADIYGPQHLLRESALPPEFFYANPSWLRPCYRMKTIHNCWLHHYSADIARCADGTWRVMVDRTQVPTGAGYALENRIMVSRLFPNLFRQHQVERLAAFFKQFQDTLIELSTENRGEPNIVLLSPGPYNEAYFEHSYLARYLGYPLVEAADLTTRNNEVYLKTLEGLQRVHVILRSVEDQFCDPLELNHNSVPGLAGMVQSALARKVSFANALGTGILESPALLAFLPRIANTLLQQELKINSVNTWWCGDSDSLRYVLDHLDELVIKRSFAGTLFKTVFGAELSVEEKKALRARIERHPYLFVAQDKVDLATVPVLSNDEMNARPYMLRTHMVMSSPQHISVMPGGLTRVSGSMDTLRVSMKQGGGCKDTWILSEKKVPPVSLLPPPDAPILLRRSTTDLPSRTADNLFWMGRYAERAESGVRLLRGILSRLNSETTLGENPEIEMLIQCASSQFQPFTAQIDNWDTVDATRHVEDYVHKSIFDPAMEDSLQSSLRQLRLVAWNVKDRISIDAWRLLTRLDQDFMSANQQRRNMVADASELMNHMLIHLEAFSGLGMESMTRTLGWRFLDIGRRVERALSLLQLTRLGLTEASDDEVPQMQAVLEIADSSMTYRSRYLSVLQAAAIVDLLLLDETNPRSVAFQVSALHEHVEKLPRSRVSVTRTQEQRIPLSVLTRLRLVDAHQLCSKSILGERMQLIAATHEWRQQMLTFSTVLSQAYFNHLDNVKPSTKEAQARKSTPGSQATAL